MTEPDRLAKLRRQRALIAEHLAWLDQEIASMSDGAAGDTSSVPTSAPAPASSKGRPQAEAPAESDETDAIIQQYQVAPGDLQRQVRQGCLLYFVGAFLLLGLGVVALYLAFRH